MKMRRLLSTLGIAACVVFFSMNAPHAQVNSRVNPRGVQDDHIVVLSDLPYIQGGEERQQLDLYLPKNDKESDQPIPVVVVIHGGGWANGSKTAPKFVDWARFFAENGCASASIHYRFVQQAPMPAQIVDCKSAVRWLRAHAKEYNLDSARFAAIGSSAGGHLSALLGTTGETREYDQGEYLDQSSSIQAVCDICGPSDFLTFLEQRQGNPEKPRIFSGTEEEIRMIARAMSPFHHVSNRSAPTLILHAVDDPTVPIQQSRVFYQALQKARVESELIEIPTGGHGAPDFTSPEMKKRILEFFNKHFGRVILNQHWIAASTPEELRGLFSLKSRLFAPDSDGYLIDAHRGGGRKGFPENCLETFDDLLKQMPAIFEIDPRLTKDNVVVLMHDAALERTTNGTGKVKDYTYEELQRFRLKDSKGELTDFQIPTLKKAIEWAKGKAVLLIDKKDVPIETTMQMIRELKAETCCMVIAYNYDEAKKYYADNPNLMMEVFITKPEDVERFDKTGVPWENVIPFVGMREPAPEVYRLLREKGRPCMIGTSQSLDHEIRKTGDASVFKGLIERGASIVETDLPLEARAALKE